MQQVLRNNLLHYDNDMGVEKAATYHSAISMVKLHGSSAWDFIGIFFFKSLTGAGICEYGSGKNRFSYKPMLFFKIKFYPTRFRALLSALSKEDALN